MKNILLLFNGENLFQLIAGVFVNFGSAQVLEKYYGQFREAIENLHDAVHDFDKHESADVEDILMARLIERISKDYHDLIANRNKDDLKIIRWCLKNDYLQQALTHSGNEKIRRSISCRVIFFPE